MSSASWSSSCRGFEEVALRDEFVAASSSESLMTTGLEAEAPLVSLAGAETWRSLRLASFDEDAPVWASSETKAGVRTVREHRMPSFLIPQHCPFVGGREALV